MVDEVCANYTGAYHVHSDHGHFSNRRWSTTYHLLPSVQDNIGKSYSKIGTIELERASYRGMVSLNGEDGRGLNGECRCGTDPPAPSIAYQKSQSTVLNPQK